MSSQLSETNWQIVETDLHVNIRTLKNLLMAKRNGRISCDGVPIEDKIDQFRDAIDASPELAELSALGAPFGRKWAWTKWLIEHWREDCHYRPSKGKINRILWVYEDSMTREGGGVDLLIHPE